jgi:hypothetical protein
MKTNLHSKNTQGNIKRKVIEEYPCPSLDCFIKNVINLRKKKKFVETYMFSAVEKIPFHSYMIDWSIGCCLTSSEQSNNLDNS